MDVVGLVWFPRMDGRHEGGGSRRPTRNGQLLQELHRKTAPHRTEVRLSRTAIHPGCAHFSGRWRGVEGFEGLSRLLRFHSRSTHPVVRNPEDVDVVPSMNR